MHSLDDILRTLEAYAEYLNSAIAMFIALPALVFRITRREPLRSRRATGYALDFWITQWLLLMFFYAARIVVTSDLPIWLTIFIVDLHSIAMIGFGLAYLQGDSCRPGSIWMSLLAFCAILFAYHSLVGSLLGASEAGSFLRYIWIVPPVLLSLLAFLFFSAVFLLRYGWLVWPLAVTCVIYSALQWPVYMSIVVKREVDFGALLLLAFFKLILGSFFYLYFFTPLPIYPPLKLVVVDENVRGEIVRRAKTFSRWAGGIVATVMLGLLVNWISQMLLAGSNN